MSSVTRFTTPVNSKTRKSDLVEVSLALELDTSGTVKDLVARITTHLGEHPELATTPRFQGLFTGRANNPSRGSKMNSAEKAQADKAAADNPAGNLTSAHLALLKEGYKTDADPKYARLGQGSHPGNRGTDGSPGLGSDVDDSSPPGSPRALTPPQDDDDSNPAPKARALVKKDALIMVVFQPESGGPAPPQEVYAQGVPVYAEGDEGQGDQRFTARLTDLLPEAFNQDTSLSPIKKSNSHLFRRGVADPDSHSSLGHVEDVLDPACRPVSLKVEQINHYPLEIHGPDIFTCRLFYKDSSEMMAASSSGHKATSQGTSGLDDNNEYPLLRARAAVEAQREAEVSAMDDKGEPKPGFNAFLRGHLGLKVKDLILERAMTMKVVLEHVTLLNKVLQQLQGWGRLSSAGYQVPSYEQFGQFAGVKFTKAHILGAIGMKTTKMNGDEGLLSDESLAYAPAAKDWARNPETSDHRECFENMQIAKFKKYLQEQKAKSRALRRTSGDIDAKERRMEKRKRRQEEEDDEEEFSGKVSRKGKKAVDSDNFDE
ncbi:hypothetical protein FA13DRAFT_1801971 [Coprinellus micaceus]|uniref:Uncharacterized protein n=1 Tax=Coprinellus micaceus TaxID=71717 RepID=A0A4Y7SDV1_COPMI|nr:hypothetical protein FA13DRAFT_1801971 [Coprinellus micaceus]